MQDFETWWASYWKGSSGTGIMDAAFKELALAAWNASRNALKA